MHYSATKITAILASVALAILLCVPNVLPTATQDYWRDHFGLRPMTLGLDLQGGSNILLEIDKKDLTDKLEQQLTSDIRASLREAKIGYSNLVRTGTGASVAITKPEDMENAKTALQKLLQPVQTGGVFAQGGVPIFTMAKTATGYALDVSEAGLTAKVNNAISQSIKIVENRINGTGVAESTVQQQGQDRIVVQLPGVKDPEKVVDVIGTTAKLTFQLLCDDQPTAANQNPPQDCKAYPRKEDVDALQAKKPKGEKVTPQELKALPQLWAKTASRDMVDGGDLVDAQSSFDQNNRPVVTFKFNTKGSQRFGKLTADNVNKPFAIILDDVVQSYPRINEPILGGSGQISGNFTTEETGKLSVVLRSGALPANLVIVQRNTVGPSLGSDSIKAGVTASLVGLVAVMIFIMLPYGFFGLIANLALLANLAMLLAIMSFFGFTLTLPGIAGIVLTLGMAVDSNVLIYERIREEWRNGRSAMNAIETGFKAALATVVDANVTTLIAAMVLFGIGSGPIRGFAVTLFIGILTTMFTAFTLTRMIVSVWMRRTRPKEINL
ncbi:MAG: protein translocase subunit SecD [Hyphomicrobiales bacterium]